MKLAVRKTNPHGDDFSKECREKFYEKLWQEYLTEHLKADDKVEWFEHLPKTASEFDESLADYDAVLGTWIKDGMLTEAIIKKHPDLKYIGVGSHGYSDFDRVACRNHGITVTNTIFNTQSVAQHAMALLLEICNNVGLHNYFYRVMKWEGKSSLNTRQIELYGRKMGIIGYGNIGKQFASIAIGFGMDVMACSRTSVPGTKDDNVSFVTLNDLLTDSDVISVHCALTDETRNLINKETLKRMKQGVIIINTARGEIIDEPALLDAVNSGKVYAAGLDTLCSESSDKPSILFSNPKIITTEHIGWMSVESKIRQVKQLSENFFNWREGNPTSVIS